MWLRNSFKKKYNSWKFFRNFKKIWCKTFTDRDKVSDLELQKQNLIFLKQNLNIPIIVNDKVELIDYADGLHVGQDDVLKIHKDKNLAIKLLRKIVKNKLLGLSTHNELEILEANNFELDMIGLGAYKATNTKDISNILGEKLQYLAKM